MCAAEFLREAEALRRLADKEQREAVRTHELRDTFSETHTHLEQQRRAHSVCVHQQLQRLRSDVFRFQEQLMDAKPSPDVIERLKLSMTEVEISISAFRDTQHQRFEELLKDERALWTEISAFQKKMEVWSLPVKAAGVPSAPRSRAPAERNLPPEVTALESFLTRTGRSGGWDDIDHQSFTRVWSKHRGRRSAAYTRELRSYLPQRSEEELREHEEWMEELERLQEQRREAVRRWRSVKQREREEQQQQQKEEDEDGDDDDERCEREQREREQESERRRGVCARLQAWRSGREQQREQEREEQLREEIQRSRRSKEQRRRQEEVRMELEEHRERRREEEQRRHLQDEQRERAEREQRHRLAAEGIRRCQERDAVLLEGRREEQRGREREAQQRRRRQQRVKQKVELHVHRDPARLQRPTAAWQERGKDTGPSAATPVLQIFHRAVPAWRRDI